MLNPNYLADVSQETIEIFSEVENEIMRDIVRRILETGRITDTAKWQLEKAKEVGLLRKDVKEYLASALNMSRKEVDKLFKDAAIKSLAVDDMIYKQAGLVPVSILKSDNMKAILLQGTRSTQKLLRNFTRTTAKTATMALYNSLDKAYLLTEVGAYDYNRAIRQCVNELASQGMSRIAYPTGHVDTAETAVRRAVVTSLNQTCAELTLYRAEDVGWDLVEVTSHVGARPTHARWQGKVYSISGKKKGYKKLSTETGYGTGDGLCGWNCRHSFFPYFEGISERAFTPTSTREEIEENERVYQLTQKQRYYERKIRASKAECATLDQAVKSAKNETQEKMFKEDFAKASVKLKSREKKLTDYISAHPELNRQKEREWKGGFNHSVSAKAVWANRKSK